MKSTSSWVIAMGRVNGSQVIFYLPFGAMKILPYTVLVTHKNMTKKKAQEFSEWMGVMMGVDVREFGVQK